MNKYIILLVILLIILLNNSFTESKEGFSGFHEVNNVVRYMKRCNAAIGSLKNGIWGAFNIISAKKSGEQCEHHWQCSKKCICEQNVCNCIPNSNK
jgi:hypothetical protein